MKSDEYGAEQNPERAGQRGEGEAQAHARADKSDRDCKEVKVSQEPERSLVDDASVALMLGNVVDRLVFDAHTVSADSAVARSATGRRSPVPAPRAHCRSALSDNDRTYGYVRSAVTLWSVRGRAIRDRI